METPIPITDQIRSSLDLCTGEPVLLVDSATGKEFALLPVEEYRSLMATAYIRDTYEAASRAFAAIWDDPELDVYNDEPGAPE